MAVHPNSLANLTPGRKPGHKPKESQALEFAKRWDKVAEREKFEICERLLELAMSDDERIAVAACRTICEHRYPKPKVVDMHIGNEGQEPFRLVVNRTGKGEQLPPDEARMLREYRQMKADALDKRKSAE